jgi:hypothetical protein
MTTNTNNVPDLSALHNAIDNADDMIAVLDELKLIVPAHVFEALALAFDICPVHVQDLDSCADDDTPAADTEAARGPIPLAACRHFRN